MPELLLGFFGIAQEVSLRQEAKQAVRMPDQPCIVPQEIPQAMITEQRRRESLTGAFPIRNSAIGINDANN